MHRTASAADAPSPAAIADLALVAALLGVLTGLSWGVIWVQYAAAAEAPPAGWLGAVPPVVTALCGAGLLGVRSTYERLPRLRRFLTRVGVAGLCGSVVLASCVVWISLG